MYKVYSFEFASLQPWRFRKEKRNWREKERDPTQSFDKTLTTSEKFKKQRDNT